MRSCPVCQSPLAGMPAHPEVELGRCRTCGHVASRLLAGVEDYDEDYFDEAHQQYFNNPYLDLFERIERALPAGTASVIDLGCGRGGFLRYLRGRRPELELTGIDIAPNQPEAGIRFIRGDLLALPVERSYDAVVSIAVIEHLPDVRAFASRLAAYCAPGGLVCVMTVNTDSILYRLAEYLRRFGVGGPYERLYQRHHLNHFTRRSLARLLGEQGLAVERTLMHNLPLSAIDLPRSGPLAGAAMRAGLLGIHGLGRACGRTWLQTVFARRG